MDLRRALFAFALTAAVAGAPAPALAQVGATGIDIPFTKYVLDNGLTLIVHEDHKAPIVAVNVWYHVGSKNEKLGKTGFAHLFEHLMFNGSENFNDDTDFAVFASPGNLDRLERALAALQAEVVAVPPSSSVTWSGATRSISAVAGPTSTGCGSTS